MSSCFARPRAQATPANPPPTITTRVFGDPLSAISPPSGAARLARRVAVVPVGIHRTPGGGPDGGRPLVRVDVDAAAPEGVHAAPAPGDVEELEVADGR